MLRRFNYTDRKRISREDVSIAVQMGSQTVFDADLSLLATYGFDPRCRLFVEAYRQTIWMRFDFGMIGAIEPPPDRSLGRFGTLDGIQFRVKVTDASNGQRLVAEADGIPLREADGSPASVESLLRIVPASLEGRVFRLSYDDQGPILEINREAGDKAEIARDAAFAALVYPAVFSDILVRILHVGSHDDVENTDKWQSQWLKFASRLSNVPSLPDDLDDEDLVDDWIRDAVSAFGKSTDVMTKFASYWEEQQ